MTRDQQKLAVEYFFGNVENMLLYHGPPITTPNIKHLKTQCELLSRHPYDMNDIIWFGLYAIEVYCEVYGKRLNKSMIRTFWSRIDEIQEGKGDDYAGDEDRLSNFRRVGEMCGTNPPLACLHLIATKIARLETLLANTSGPKNETIEDSFIDLVSYLSLYYCIVWQDKNQELYSEPI